jgi:hypothetical protein
MVGAPSASHNGGIDTTRAIAVLLLQLVLVLLGAPGLDMVPRALDAGDLRDLRSRGGEALAGAAEAVVAANRDLRLPLTDALQPLQRPFRVAQEWFLYRDGPSRVRRLEVRVDGELVHRSVDAEHAWLAPQLRSRRLRPVVESTCGDADAPNWRGLARFVTDRARAAWPAAREVRLDCTAAPFPGDDATRHHGYVAAAPDWEPHPR